MNVHIPIATAVLRSNGKLKDINFRSNGKEQMLLYVLCKQYQNYEWKIKFKVDLIMFWLLFLDKVNKIGSRAGIKKIIIHFHNNIISNSIAVDCINCTRENVYFIPFKTFYFRLDDFLRSMENMRSQF